MKILNVRTTIYLDKNLAKKVEKYDNKSKLVKEALNMYFLNKDYFLSKKSIVEDDIHDLKYKLERKKKELEFIDKQLTRINKKSKERPAGYINAVNTLRCLSDVSDDDLDFQAKRLFVHPNDFKEWLCVDGYYEEIFSS